MQLCKTATCFVNYLCRIGKPGSESEAGICVTFERFFLLLFWFNDNLFTCGSQTIIIFAKAYKIAKCIN
jgi:hypothetical protein